MIFDFAKKILSLVLFIFKLVIMKAKLAYFRYLQNRSDAKSREREIWTIEAKDFLDLYDSIMHHKEADFVILDVRNPEEIKKVKLPKVNKVNFEVVIPARNSNRPALHPHQKPIVWGRSSRRFGKANTHGFFCLLSLLFWGKKCKSL